MHPCPYMTRTSSSSSGAGTEEASSQQEQQQQQQQSTLAAVSELLEQALALQDDSTSGGGGSGDSSDSSELGCALIEFLDSASHLRWADLSQPGDKAAGTVDTHTDTLLAVCSVDYNCSDSRAYYTLCAVSITCSVALHGGVL
jgi:hypothetical protein